MLTHRCVLQISPPNSVGRVVSERQPGFDGMAAVAKSPSACPRKDLRKNNMNTYI